MAMMPKGGLPPDPPAKIFDNLAEATRYAMGDSAPAPNFRAVAERLLHALSWALQDKRLADEPPPYQTAQALLPHAEALRVAATISERNDESLRDAREALNEASTALAEWKRAKGGKP